MIFTKSFRGLIWYTNAFFLLHIVINRSLMVSCSFIYFTYLRVRLGWYWWVKEVMGLKKMLDDIFLKLWFLSLESRCEIRNNEEFLVTSWIPDPFKSRGSDSFSPSMSSS